MKENNEITEISDKEIFDWVKSILCVFAGLTVIVAFTKNIRYFILNFFVSNRLDAVDASYLLDILVLTTVFIFAALQVNSCINSRPNKYFSFLLLLAIPFYLFERYTEGFFIFTDFKILNSIAYFDLFLLIPLIHFGGYLKFIFPRKLKPQVNSLLDDSPIEKIEDDELDGLYDDSAAKIFNILNDNNFKSAFTVGLNGEWGDGKTSVFNLLKAKITGEDFIVFDFNPWMGYDKKVLVRDFFTALSESLGQDLADEFGTYSEELLDNGNTFSIPRLIRNIFYRKKSLKTSFEEINDKIGLIQKKIIVFIDDVDRLDKEEIFELLKLLRNTANFQNVFFIVAYDRTYVNESIKAHSAESTIKYLDKIINVEINLPYYDKSILKNYFQDKLKGLLPTELGYKVDDFIKSYEKDLLAWDLHFAENDLFVYWLNNFREIKKVVNSIIVNNKKLYEQLNFIDLVHLEILKLKHPLLYRILYTKRDEILKEMQTHHIYYQRPLDESKAAAKQFERFVENNSRSFVNKKSDDEDLTVLDFYISKYITDNAIGDIEPEKINDLMLRLFPKMKDGKLTSEIVLDKPEEPLSVRYISNYERYFSHTIFRYNIDDQKFEEFLNLSTDQELYSKVDQWIAEGKTKTLSHKLTRRIYFASEQQYRNVLLALIYLEKKKTGNEDIIIDINSLLEKMYTRNLYSDVLKDEKKAGDFFKNLFFDSPPPSFIEANILHTLRLKNKRKQQDDPYRFPLSDDEIYSLLEAYVTEFLNSEQNFEEGFWDLLFAAVKTAKDGQKYIENNIQVQINESLSTMERRENFLKSLINPMGAFGFKLRLEAIKLVFSDFDAFETFFFESTSPVISEFKEFYDKSKSINWEDTEFHFIIINEDDLS